jgi:hypothetical protein
MRFIGLDVHRDFCEVAIAEAARSAPRYRVDRYWVGATGSPGGA